MRMVTQMCALNTTLYAESLAMTDGQTLIIGAVDEIQKLHIRTVSLGETVRRIAYQEQTQTFGVLTVRYEILDANGSTFAPRPSASTLAQTTSQSHGMNKNQAVAGGSSGTTANQRSTEGEELEVTFVKVPVWSNLCIS